jgi:outer membrane protein assembly factor BamD
MRRKLVVGLLTLVVALTACRSALREDPVLALSAEESLAQGKAQMERQRYGDARKYLLHAFEVEPNSAQGREALLLAADCYFLDGGAQNWIQAEAKYRDFQNRFPTSNRAAYVQFQIGRSLAARMEKPDRDQSTATKALRSFEDLVRLYPTSEYATQAVQEIRRVRNNLGEHEYRVGLFYLRYGLPAAAAGRFELILRDFQDFDAPDKVLYHLGVAQMKMNRSAEAKSTFDRLRSEHPASRWIAEIPEVKLPAATSEAAKPA